MIKQTRYGWVDLSNLPKKGSSFDWDKCIGKTVDFQYEDIVSTLTIVGRYNNQYMYIDIPGYVSNHSIYVGQIKNGQLGACIQKRISDFKYEIGSVVNGLLLLSSYRTKYKHYRYRCLKDGYEGNIREDHLCKWHGCPICRNSIGEKKVKEYLKKHGVNFVQQHTFNDCKNIKELPFDFYLPDYNACIEYDGLQHFEPVDFGGRGEEYAIKQFEDLQVRDGIKNSYCQNNHIFLCRIKYTQNVKTTLDLFFKNLNNTQQND